RRVRFLGEFDVGTATGHVGGDRDVAGQLTVNVFVLVASAGDDVRLALVLLGVEHFMLDAVFASQRAAQHLAFFDARGTDQNRTALAALFLDLVDNRFVLLFLGAIDAIFVVDANHRTIGRDAHHVELIDLAEFLGFGLGGAGHAAEGFV